MPITTLYPNANDAASNCTVVGAASYWEALDDPKGVYDDATTRVEMDAIAATQYYRVAIQNLPSYAAVVFSAQQVIRGIKTNPAAVQAAGQWWIAAGWYTCGITLTQTAWTTFTGTLTTLNPATAAAWTVADINGLSIGATRALDAAEENRVTAQHCDVSWAPADGGFAVLIAQWLPPLLAVASHGLLWREIQTILSKLTGSGQSRPDSREDFTRTLEAFRRRPVYGYSR